VIWPYVVLAEYLEALEFTTDVLRARAAEQRVRLTDIPRRSFSHNYRLDPMQYERARALLRTGLPGPFWLPEWAEAVAMPVSAAQTVFNVDTTVRQYAVGGRVAVVANGAGEVLEITDVAPGAVTVDTGPVAGHAEALVAPAFEAFAPGGMRTAHDVDGIYLSAVEWQLFEGPDWGAGFTPSSTYRGDPLLDVCAEIGDSPIQEAIERALEVVDSGIGRPYFDDVLSSAVQTLGASWMPYDAEIMALRRWFYYLRGRQRAFWLPAWNRGVRLVANVAGGAGSIVIESIGFADAYGSGDVFFRMADGTVHTLQVGSAVDNGVTETLTLVGTAPAIVAADVRTSCLMFRVRLAADRIEFAHMAGFGARVQVPCVEVPL
jgi:hypothetical protein